MMAKFYDASATLWVYTICVRRIKNTFYFFVYHFCVVVEDVKVEMRTEDIAVLNSVLSEQ